MWPKIQEDYSPKKLNELQLKCVLTSQRSTLSILPFKVFCNPKASSLPIHLTQISRPYPGMQMDQAGERFFGERGSTQWLLGQSTLPPLINVKHQPRIKTSSMEEENKPLWTESQSQSFTQAWARLLREEDRQQGKQKQRKERRRLESRSTCPQGSRNESDQPLTHPGGERGRLRRERVSEGLLDGRTVNFMGRLDCAMVPRY